MYILTQIAFVSVDIINYRQPPKKDTYAPTPLSYKTQSFRWRDFSEHWDVIYEPD